MPSDSARASSPLDVKFSVPFVHRLRFTRDLFQTDGQVLVDLLQSSDGRPARVQFWLDSHVLRAQPEIEQRIFALVKQNPSQIELAGNVQLVPGGEEVKNEVHLLEQMLKVFHAHELDRRSYVAANGDYEI